MKILISPAQPVLRRLQILSEGHISYYTTVRGPDILRNVIASGYLTFYQINKCFVQVLFFVIVKMSSGPFCN